jgi:methionyl-tRNA formyltransferase
MTALTIVGFASGSPQSEAAMRRIARDHHLLAIVVPRQRGGLRESLRRLLRRSKNPFAGLSAPLIDFAEVAKFRPDVFVVASFPKIIPAKIFAAARLGALNMHSSLLPRHRGPDPLFWTYWQDDRDAGMTIHWMTDRIDAGDVIVQQAIPLERGLPSRVAYTRLTAHGVDLLSEALVRVGDGSASRTPQNDALATYESAADIAAARIPFASWAAERVWHVISGLGDQFTGLVVDPLSGKRLAHGRAVGYRLTQDCEPGRVATTDAGYELHCIDGIVAAGHRRW